MASRDIERRISRLEEQSGFGRIRTVHLLNHWLTDKEAEAEKTRLLRSGEASPDACFIRYVVVNAQGQPVDMSHRRPKP